DYDFAFVDVVDRAHPEQIPPSIHPAYAPTQGIKPGDQIKFLVRTFGTTDGEETWDLGDGSPKVIVHSDGNVAIHAKDGYAITTHKYDKPGVYLARVERTDRRSEEYTSELQSRGHLVCRLLLEKKKKNIEMLYEVWLMWYGTV